MSTEKELKLVIGIPSGPTWDADFAMSMLGLMSYLNAYQVPGFTKQMVRLHNVKGSILAKSRHIVVSQALEHNATHVLFIDSDMVFPQQLAHRLFATGKSVVACNCPTKKIPSFPTARKKSFTKPAGDIMYLSEEGGPDLQKAWRVGTGVMLIDLRVLKNVPSPYFATIWDEGLQDYMGEDWYFCSVLEKAGVEIWIDNVSSRAIGHSGQLIYDHSLVEEEKERPSITLVGDANAG